MRKIAVTLASSVLLLAAIACQAQEHDHAGARENVSAIRKPSKQPDITLMRGKMITFPSAIGGNANGYLSLPDDKHGKHPAVVVIQEWWGLNDWVREQADRLAKDGYVALAVDLYRGKSTSDPNIAHELMRGMPEDRANADLKAGFDYLASRPDVDPAHIGSIGWCMGGGYSLNLALAEPRLAACVINYGHLITDPASIEKLKSPILGDFGALDRGITPDDVNAFAAALQKTGKTADIKIYPDAGHGFMNPNNKDGFKEADAADAWRRIDAFFAKNLR